MATMSSIDDPKDLPFIVDLCRDLGYGETREPRRRYDLTKSTRSFRQNYVSSTGRPGEDIRIWDPFTGNHDLREMAQKFLEDGYGSKHWPRGHGPLEYPKHKAK